MVQWSKTISTELDISKQNGKWSALLGFQKHAPIHSGDEILHQAHMETPVVVYITPLVIVTWASVLASLARSSSSQRQDNLTLSKTTTTWAQIFDHSNRKSHHL